MTIFNIFSRKKQQVSFHITNWSAKIVTSVADVRFYRQAQGANELIPFYVNNMGSEDIPTVGRGPGMSSDVDVVLRPGWNEYLFERITFPKDSAVQWGE